MKNTIKSILVIPFFVFPVFGGCLLAFACDTCSCKKNPRDKITFLVQINSFNMPTDQFALMHYDSAKNDIASSAQFDFAHAVNHYGTNIDLNADGFRNVSALGLWSWQKGRYQLYYTKNLDGGYEKKVFDTQSQRITYTLSHDSSWGADGDKLYAVKDWERLVAIDPATGETKTLFDDVECFIRNPCKSEFLIFDKTGRGTYRDDRGAIIREAPRGGGISSGGGYIGDGIAMYYARRNEYMSGHLVIINVGGEHSKQRFFDMPHCVFLKTLDRSEE